MVLPGQAAPAKHKRVARSLRAAVHMYFPTWLAICLLGWTVGCWGDDPTRVSGEPDAGEQPPSDAGDEDASVDAEADAATGRTCNAYDRSRVIEIAASQLCDGVPDCGPPDDEVDCPDQVVCYVNDWSEFVVVARDKFCDGKVDCSQLAYRDGVRVDSFQRDRSERVGYDELDCPGEFVCGWISQAFGLQKATVIADNQLCDGHWDCVVDEFDCPGEDRFTCADGRTIPASEICDETAQCWDASDEDSELCPGRFACWATIDVHSLDYDKFTYSDETYGPRYIPIAQVCDGTQDCKYGDDEQRCQ